MGKTSGKTWKKGSTWHAKLRKVAALVIAFMVAVTLSPFGIPETGYADATESIYKEQVSDPSTLDNWQTYFGTNDNFNTRHVGHVWTDKSVLMSADEFEYAKELTGSSNSIKLSEDENNFLVSLSAMTSTMSIKGQENKPTHTMFVLDLSSSMYRYEEMGKPAVLKTDTVQAMLDAVNNSIKKLQEINVNNKVGVVIYYGGTTQVQATKNSHKVLLPLDRYTHSDNKYLTVTTNGAQLSGVKVNSNVKNSDDESVTASHDVTEIAGTYTQQGILAAHNQFMAANTKVPDDAEFQAGADITPILVLMSDGQPTAATNQYTNLNVGAVMGNNTVSIRDDEETDFVTQLTAAYTREKMDLHYAAEDPIFYTLSLNSGNYTVSWDVMDPVNTLKQAFESPATDITATIAGYWDTLLKYGKVNIEIYDKVPNENKTYSVEKVSIGGTEFPSSIDQKAYVDKAFRAQDATSLANAFEEIFDDISIQTHYYPTLVEDDANLDGYVSFNDKIGEYMNVTDMKGIIVGNTWYSGGELAKNFVESGNGGALGTYESPTELGNELVASIQERIGINADKTRALLGAAYDAGQLSYYNSENFSNYVGWYADSNNNYLGFWDENSESVPGYAANAVYTVKSYIYLGETGIANDAADTDMMYATVRLRTDMKTGEEMVSFAAPASLLPTIEYDVELDSDGTLQNIEKAGAEKPIRLVYEVALEDGIDEKSLSKLVDETYIENNTENGYVNFYTNQYEKLGEGETEDDRVGYGKVNTYSYFRPSHENDNYYYQENATIYSDKSGTVYKGEAKPTGTYYRAVKVYGKESGSSSENIEYIKISASALNESERKDDDSWYVPNDTVHTNTNDYILSKSENCTGTLQNANLAFVDVNEPNSSESGHYFMVGDTLGNNGKLAIKPVIGIKLTKTVEGGGETTTPVTDSFEFTIEKENLIGEYDVVRIADDGTESTEKISFANDKATISLKDGETVYIDGIPEGTYKITENETAEYVVDAVEIDGIEVNSDGAIVDVDQSSISEVDFTNVLRGTGGFSITKTVEHSLGTDYIIPEDVNQFEMVVTLEGIAVSEDLKVLVQKGNEEQPVEAAVEKSGDDYLIKIELKDDETATLSNIPEGTVVTVAETAKANFAASYKINPEDCNETPKLEIIKGNNSPLVKVINTYTTKPVEVDITLTGSKTMDDWEKETFKFLLQKSGADGGWETIETCEVGPDNRNITLEGEDLKFAEVGTYSYRIVEESAGETIEGITYDSVVYSFDVFVTDNDMDGQLEATVEATNNTTNEFTNDGDHWKASGISFKNEKNNGKTSEVIKIKKALINPSGSQAVSLKGYEFGLYDVNGELVASAITDKAGEASVQLNYEYDDVKTDLKNSTDGTVTYKYTLKEKASGITGMTDSTNTYEYEVVISAVDGVESGSITSELKSTNYDGIATFTNTYDPEDVDVEFNVNKKITGRDLVEGEFIFVLEALDGAPLPKADASDASAQVTAVNDAEGKIDFDAINFSKIGEYEYLVYEKPIEEENGVNVDETKHKIVVTVTDEKDDAGNYTGRLKAETNVVGSEDASITFNNAYEAESTNVVINGTKKLIGADLKDGQFNFILMEIDKDGKEVADGKTLTAVNDETGCFEFDTIEYTKAGTYYYLISEEIPIIKHGIKYDDTEYTVEVTVTDDLKGTLTAESKIVKPVNTSEVSFINEYDPFITITGDGFNIFVFMTLGLLAMIGAVLAFLRRKPN